MGGISGRLTGQLSTLVPLATRVAHRVRLNGAVGGVYLAWLLRGERRAGRV